MSSSRIALIAAVFSLASRGAFAQGAPTPQARVAPTVQVDSRFAGWLGCWRLEDDLLGAGNVRVCVTPEQLTGVKLQTLVGAQQGALELLQPDNVARPISDADCKGNERSEWSKDGLRVFRYADVGCGQESPRKLSSVSFLMRGPAMVQVQFVETMLTKSVRVQRYRRAVDQSMADGSLAPQPSPMLAMISPSADVRWDIDDVVEASAKLPGDAVEAALTAVNGPFDLSRRNLLAMSNAKVSEGVIDLMVALTYPKRLVVDRAGSAYSGATGLSMGGGWYDPFMAPYMSSSSFYGDCNSPLIYAYHPCGTYYGMSGFGLYNPYYEPYYGNGYYGGGYNSGWVIVSPVQPNAPVDQPEGRAVNGRGYTQIRQRDPEPTPRLGNTGNGNSGTNSTGNTNGGTNSGTSGVSTGGYSGGSSSGGGDVRTAVPKPPGQ